MGTRNARGLNRRGVVIGGAAASVAAVLGTRTALATPSIQSGGGLSGGGTIAAGDTVATFSIFATRFKVENEIDPLIVGRIQWLDGAGFGFESTKITSYGPIDGDDPNARAIEGTAKLVTGDEVEFRIRALDAGSPLVTKDTLHVTAGPDYEVEGELASGDLQLLTFDFPA